MANNNSVVERCALCYCNLGSTLEVSKGIAKDSMVMCEDCSKYYDQDGYHQKLILVKAIKCYRQLAKQYEAQSKTRINTTFNVRDESDKK